MTTFQTLFFISTFIIPFSVWSANQAKSPVRKKNIKKYEVKFNQLNRKVDVYTPATTGEIPENMTITLLHDKKTGQTVRLKAMQPTRAGYFHYQGQLDPSEASFIGFQLQFDLESPPSSPLPSFTPETP